MQHFSEVADLGCGIGGVVGQIEAVVILGLFSPLAGCLEELTELCEPAVAGLEDLVQQGSGLRLRFGPVEPVGQSTKRITVDIGGGAVGSVGTVRGLGRVGRRRRRRPAPFSGQ
ncbi:hypothetical protein ACIRO1_33060 [Streptomyces sp. NPDC102381]|uniref:hypothetical protein n=1 Tax=Streptomyces sp. NPDC102381 TaxID=3366164 RepID=UPI00381B082F